MAKKDLVRLLVRLYGDPKLHERLKKDPAKVLGAAGLSAKEQALLRSADAGALREYLGAESAKSVIKNLAGLSVIKASRVGSVIKAKTALSVIKSKTKK
jgi:hypothetical protein